MAASEAMVAAGEHLSSSRPVRRAKTRPAARIPLCVEPPPPFAEGPGPGRDWWEKALSEKSFRAGKHENSQQNQSVGAKSRTTTFGPFGEVIRATGPMAKANPFRFSTKYQDDESDFDYYGYRYLNTSTGRWLNRDPILEDAFQINFYPQRPKFKDTAEDVNEYLLVHSDPLDFYDVWGLCVTVTGGSGTIIFNSRFDVFLHHPFPGIHTRRPPALDIFVINCPVDHPYLESYGLGTSSSPPSFDNFPNWGGAIGGSPDGYTYSVSISVPSSLIWFGKQSELDGLYVVGCCSCQRGSAPKRINPPLPPPASPDEPPPYVGDPGVPTIMY